MKSVFLVALCALLHSGMGERYFADGVDESDLDGEGAWTEWMNCDTPNGAGELEDVIEQQDRYNDLEECKMFCDAPIAMDVEPANSNHVWDEITVCTNQILNPTTGYWCENRHNYDTSALPDECFDSYCDKNGLNSQYTGACRRCPDVKVRYFCQGNKEALIEETCGAQKARSADRKEWEDNYKKRMLADIEAEKKREEKESTSLTKLIRKLLKELDN